MKKYRLLHIPTNYMSRALSELEADAYLMRIEEQLLKGIDLFLITDGCENIFWAVLEEPLPSSIRNYGMKVASEKEFMIIEEDTDGIKS